MFWKKSIKNKLYNKKNSKKEKTAAIALESNDLEIKQASY